MGYHSRRPRRSVGLLAGGPWGSGPSDPCRGPQCCGPPKAGTCIHALTMLHTHTHTCPHLRIHPHAQTLAHTSKHAHTRAHTPQTTPTHPTNKLATHTQAHPHTGGGRRTVGLKKPPGTGGGIKFLRWGEKEVADPAQGVCGGMGPFGRTVAAERGVERRGVELAKKL